MSGHSADRQANWFYPSEFPSEYRGDLPNTHNIDRVGEVRWQTGDGSWNLPPLHPQHRCPMSAGEIGSASQVYGMRTPFSIRLQQAQYEMANEMQQANAAMSLRRYSTLADDRIISSDPYPRHPQFSLTPIPYCDRVSQLPLPSLNSFSSFRHKGPTPYTRHPRRRSSSKKGRKIRHRSSRASSSSTPSSDSTPSPSLSSSSSSNTSSSDSERQSRRKRHSKVRRQNREPHRDGCSTSEAKVVASARQPEEGAQPLMPIPQPCGGIGKIPMIPVASTLEPGEHVVKILTLEGITLHDPESVFSVSLRSYYLFQLEHEYVLEPSGVHYFPTKPTPMRRQGVRSFTLTIPQVSFTIHKPRDVVMFVFQLDCGSTGHLWAIIYAEETGTWVAGVRSGTVDIEKSLQSSSNMIPGAIVRGTVERSPCVTRSLAEPRTPSEHSSPKSASPPFAAASSHPLQPNMVEQTPQTTPAMCGQSPPHRGRATVPALSNGNVEAKVPQNGILITPTRSSPQRQDANMRTSRDPGSPRTQRTAGVTADSASPTCARSQCRSSNGDAIQQQTSSPNATPARTSCELVDRGESHRNQYQSQPSTQANGLCPHPDSPGATVSDGSHESARQTYSPQAEQRLGHAANRPVANMQSMQQPNGVGVGPQLSSCSTNDPSLKKHRRRSKGNESSSDSLHSSPSTVSSDNEDVPVAHQSHHNGRDGSPNEPSDVVASQSSTKSTARHDAGPNSRTAHVSFSPEFDFLSTSPPSPGATNTTTPETSLAGMETGTGDHTVGTGSTVDDVGALKPTGLQQHALSTSTSMPDASVAQPSPVLSNGSGSLQVATHKGQGSHSAQESSMAANAPCLPKDSTLVEGGVASFTPRVRIIAPEDSPKSEPTVPEPSDLLIPSPLQPAALATSPPIQPSSILKTGSHERDTNVSAHRTGSASAAAHQSGDDHSTGTVGNRRASPLWFFGVSPWYKMEGLPPITNIALFDVDTDVLISQAVGRCAPPGKLPPPVPPGHGPDGNSVSFSVDAVSGLPTNAVCTRLVIYVTDQVDLSTGLITDSDVFKHRPALISYQNAESLSISPSFLTEINITMSDSSHAIAIVEYSIGRKQTPLVLGHFCVPLNKMLPRGGYVSRIKMGDPRRSLERNTESTESPEAITAQQATAVETYGADMLEASMSSAALCFRMPLAPFRRAECVPGCFVTWRLDEPDPMCFCLDVPGHQKLSKMELDLVTERTRNAAAHASTPISLGIPNEIVARELFAEPAVGMGTQISYLSTYNPQRGFFVRIEGIRGVGGSPSLYAVAVDIRKAKSSTPFITAMPDWNSDVGAPQFFDPPMVFLNVECDVTSAAVFTLWRVMHLFAEEDTDSPSPTAEPIAWCACNLFLDELNIVRQGRFALPWLLGTPPDDCLKDMDSESMSNVLLKYMRKKEVSFLSPRASLIVNIGDPICVPQLADTSVGRMLPHKLMMPRKIRHEFPICGEEGTVGCTLRRLHEDVYQMKESPLDTLKRMQRAITNYSREKRVDV